MKRFILTLAILIGTLSPALVAAPVSAGVDLFSGCGSGSSSGVPGVCVDAKTGEKTTVNPIAAIISGVVQILAFIVGVAAIIGIVVSGIRFITANGDSNSIASARRSLVFSLVGVAVAVLAKVITNLVLTWLSH